MGVGLVYVGAVNKVKCAPTLKGAVKIHSDCNCRRACAALMSLTVGMAAIACLFPESTALMTIASILAHE